MTATPAAERQTAMTDSRPDSANPARTDARTADGEYLPAGAGGPTGATFGRDAIAGAFAVDPSRVEAALAGEFGLEADAVVSSTQAQDLAEVLLGDQPLDVREAALMRLGAFTPRADHEIGLGEKDPADESDRLVRPQMASDEERGEP